MIESTSQGIKKIGEATFSEVFSIEKWKDMKHVVMKVIPFGEDDTVLVNGFPQQKVQDIYQEVYTTSKLNKLSKSPKNFHFVQFLGAMICTGPFPRELLDLWDEWDESIDSENDRPGRFLATTDSFCVECMNSDSIGQHQ